MGKMDVKRRFGIVEALLALGIFGCFAMLFIGFFFGVIRENDLFAIFRPGGIGAATAGLLMMFFSIR